MHPICETMLSSAHHGTTPAPLSPTRDGPLSWEEARSVLRESLEAYLEEDDHQHHTTHPPSHHCEQDAATDNGATAGCGFLLSNWIRRYDLDLYCGALSLSVALLIVSSFELSSHSTLHDDQTTGTVDQQRVAGAVLLVVGALSGVWVVRRRRFLCLNDSHTARRREVRKFLRATSAASAVTCSSENDKDELAQNVSLHTPVPEISNLTAQTGVYPVYRRASNSNKYFWSRIPSLLLVKGDWIALQIGDMGPTACVLQQSQDDSPPLHLESGERLTVQHFSSSTADELTARLPRGRKTLDSRTTTANDQHFLTLCNNISIFTVVESPMDDFVRRTVQLGKPSQLARQLQAVRTALFGLSIAFLIVTAAITFGRLGLGYSDNDNTGKTMARTVHLPILAALGVLPVVAPAFLFFLEVVGTSRILTTVHAHSNAAANDTDENKAKSWYPKSRLLSRYVLATSLTRLSLWGLYDSWSRLLQRLCSWSSSSSSSSSKQSAHAARSKLVRVPPASVNLLEKVGVATAFTLVDDELACEPQSIPQQLLIPSGKGLKLLDLCPAYESDSDNEGDTDTSESTSGGRRQRGKSFDDSDSESEEGKHTGRSLRQKVLPKRMRRPKSFKRLHRSYRSEEETVGTQEAFRFDVQFEEPNWWQYLPSLKCIGLACLMHEEQKKTVVTEDEVSASAGDNDDLTLRNCSSEELKRESARSALVKLVCHERSSRQLRSLAECIGFSTQENASGKRGDVTPFTERLRLHVLSNQLYKNRLALDTHERSSEQSRWWGLIRADSTSVIIEDSRTKAYQLLTVGDPTIVTTLCNEAWQGEISTILPLAAIDRQTIIDTTNNWKLADLDVAAFSYTPVPHTLETQVSAELGSHVSILCSCMKS